MIDLGGNIRELSGKDGIYLNEEHTIFGVSAAVGIAIMFLIKKETREKSTCQINYIHPTDIRATRLEKLDYLKSHSLDEIPFERIKPNKNNWINLSESDFENLIPTISKDAKSGKSTSVIFELFSTGINSGRDEWLIDFDKENLFKKMSFYDSVFKKAAFGEQLDNTIKWSRNLKNKLKSKRAESPNYNKLTNLNYRPFVKTWLYNSTLFIDERSISTLIFGENLNLENKAIVVTGPGSEKPFLTLANNCIGDYHFVSSGASSQYISLYRYNKSGNRQDNITDWALNLFREHYTPKPFTEQEVSALSNEANAVFTGLKLISKEDIFHYTYAVLHNPTYRKKYELDLKREFPRLPLYADFFAWSALGKQLMDLHINYETAAPFALKLVDSVAAPSPSERAGVRPALFPILEEPEPLFTKRPKLKVKLKADKETGIIELDEQTALIGVPKAAWNYKLGNRSALEWVLDQYKEKKPSDPTIAEKFNTYRFADYKEQVINLLKRVCTVSVETMRLIGELEKLGE